MDHDIEAMIEEGCNVSCETLLSIFMEVLGGIAEGSLMELGKEKDRFEGFLRLNWLSKEYRTLNNTLSREMGKGLYEIFRCKSCPFITEKISERFLRKFNNHSAKKKMK